MNFPYRPLYICLFLFMLLPLVNVKADDTTWVQEKHNQLVDLINTNNDSVTIALEELKTFADENQDQYALLEFHQLSGMVAQRKGDFKKAIESYNQYIMIQDDSLKPGSIDHLNRIGNCLKAKGSVDSALVFFEIANNKGKAADYLKGQADSYSSRGQIAELQGAYKKAMEHYLISLNLFKQNKDSLGISSNYLNIGNLMYYQGEYEQALEYYKQSCEIDKLTNNTRFLGSSYGNIGMIYQFLAEPDSALRYNLLCMEIFEQMQDRFALGTIYNNVALVYFDLKKFDKALDFHFKSMEIKEKIGDLNGLATSNVNVGNILVEQKKYRKAQSYFEKGLELGEAFDSPIVKMNARKGLSKVYAELGEHEKALLEYVKFNQIEDSLNNLESKKQVAELETKFETAERKRELAEEKQKRSQQEILAKAESDRQKVIIGAVVVVAILLLVFAMVVWNRLSVTRKQKQVIEAKNKENELLLGEIHHRVKNNLQVVSSLLNLQQRNLKDADAREAVLESRNRVRSMALIHKKLYQVDDFSSIEMLEYTRQLAEELIEAFQLDDKNVELNINFSPLKLDVDTAVPIGLIINELLVNSMKYAFEKASAPKIDIHIEEKDGELQMSYADNGSGMAREFSVTEQQNDSFGKRLIQSLSRQLQGVVDVKNENGLMYQFRFKAYKTMVK